MFGLEIFESEPADLAVEGSLARVDRHVGLDVVFGVKAPVAHRALKSEDEWEKCFRNVILKQTKYLRPSQYRVSQKKRFDALNAPNSF